MDTIRLLLLVAIVGIAIDYFLFDGQYMKSLGQYVQTIGQDIDYEVTRILGWR